MEQKTPVKYFDENDVELMEKALALHPDLDIVAYLVKCARERVKYPIQDHNGLLPLCDEGSRSVTFKDREVTFEDAKQSLPESFFPIESEDDLLFKFFIAFAIAHTQNQPRTPLSGFEGFPSETVLFRPSPSATLFK